MHPTTTPKTAHNKTAIKAMGRAQLAQLAGVSERTLRRWLHISHDDLKAVGYRPSQRLLPPRVVRYMMDFYGIEQP